MEEEFEQWYEEQGEAFHQGHYDVKDTAYAAWLEGKRAMKETADNLKGLLVGLSVELIEKPKSDQIYHPRKPFTITNVFTDDEDILVRGKGTIWFQVQLLKIAET